MSGIAAVQAAPLNLAEQRRALMREKLVRELGPTIMRALENPKVVEIMLNPDGIVWLDVLGEGMQDSGERMKPARAENLLGTIAAMLETTIDRAHPMLQGELPLDGSRVQGVIPPMAAAPLFTIRKRAGMVFSLDEYVANGILDARHAAELRRAVRQRENILIVGSTGSGKTTLANALLEEIAKNAGGEQRVVIIEDTFELQCAAPNTVALHTTDEVDMTGCLRVTMRLRPDRIVVGEVRDHAALALLKAWNTGHPGGLSTVHANSAHAGLMRLEQLMAEHRDTQPQPALIAEAVNLLIFITRTPAGRRVTEVVRVCGFRNDAYVLEQIPGDDSVARELTPTNHPPSSTRL
jgi:P-type conjugative transfer ATPase TrbB